MKESMKNFDAALTYTSFKDHMHKARTPLQREHLNTVIHHSKGEVLADLSMVLPTLADDPQYHEFGVFGNTLADTGPKGMDQVRKNYEQMVECGSYVIESKKDRVVCSDDEIVTSGTFRQILTADVARSMGFIKPDTPASDYYLLSARTIVFWEFKNGKACGEDRFVLGHTLEPLSEDDLPANYPARLLKSRRKATA